MRNAFLQRHVVGEDGDFVASGALCVQYRLVGPAQHIGGRIAARFADRHADADGPGDHLVVDGHPFAECVLQFPGECLRGSDAHLGGGYDNEFVTAQPRDHAGASGRLQESCGEDPDEQVAGVVPEIVVDSLQPVEVEEQHRDRALATRCEPGVQVGYQRPAVLQSGQVVVLGEVSELALGASPGLHLGEQRGDGFQRIEFFLLPRPVAVLDEAQYPSGHIARHQRCGRHRATGDTADTADTAAVDEPPLVLFVGRLGADRHRGLEVLGEGVHRIRSGVEDHFQRVRVRDVQAWRPFGDEDRRANGVVVVPQEAHVDLEVLDEVGQHVLVYGHRGGRAGRHQFGGDRGDHQVQAL